MIEVDAIERRKENCQQKGKHEITKEMFNEVFQDPAVHVLMDELEISDSDRLDLFAVLDSDDSGSLNIDELITGMMALRGQAKRSDMISTKLSVKAMQQSLR